MSEKSTIQLLSEILSGTQVPRSFGPQYLGEATEPWDELRGTLRLFGYPSAEEIMPSLKNAIIDDPAVCAEIKAARDKVLRLIKDCIFVDDERMAQLMDNIDQSYIKSFGE